MNWKNRRKVAADLREVYSAPTVEAAEAALGHFEEKWPGEYQKILKSWRRHWAILKTFFGYAPDLRKVSYTTNAVESINAQLRKVISKLGTLPSEDSIRQVPLSKALK